ncbi:MAG: CHAD domain-containing protein [Balneolaceae bacterium]|nr:CHAD domain-containing protein [Balneolaceae bacterium]
MYNLLQGSYHSSSCNCAEIYNAVLEELFSFTRTGGNEPVEATHQARKKLKLLRAFAKLIKPARDSSDYKNVNIAFRDWGKVFSDLRDTHVRNILLDDFTQNTEYSDEIEPLLLLKKLNQAELSAFESATLYRHDEFTQLEENFKNTPLVRGYFSEPVNVGLVLSGFEASFLKSKEAFSNAFSEKHPEEIHEWRKRAKDVQYQTELLMSADSEDVLLNLHTKISEICDDLGVANDLHMIHTWIEENTSLAESEQFSGILNMIDSANKECLALAETRGNSFYELFPEPLSILTDK